MLSRTINSVGSTICRLDSPGIFLASVSVAGVVASGATVRISNSAARRPFSATSCRTVVSAGRSRPPWDCRRTPRRRGHAEWSRPLILGGEHHAVGNRVGEAQHGRDFWVRVQQLAERRITILLGGVVLFDHHRFDAGGGEALPPAEHPLNRHPGLRFGCFPRLQAVRPDHAGVDDADPPMAQRDQVFGCPPGPAAVVDVDAGHAGGRLLIDVDQWQFPSLQPGQRR